MLTYVLLVRPCQRLSLVRTNNHRQSGWVRHPRRAHRGEDRCVCERRQDRLHRDPCGSLDNDARSRCERGERSIALWLHHSLWTERHEDVQRPDTEAQRHARGLHVGTARLFDLVNAFWTNSGNSLKWSSSKDRPNRLWMRTRQWCRNGYVTITKRVMRSLFVPINTPQKPTFMQLPFVVVPSEVQFIGSPLGIDNQVSFCNRISNPNAILVSIRQVDQGVECLSALLVGRVFEIVLNSIEDERSFEVIIEFKSNSWLFAWLAAITRHITRGIWPRTWDSLSCLWLFGASLFTLLLWYSSRLLLDLKTTCNLLRVSSFVATNPYCWLMSCLVDQWSHYLRRIWEHHQMHPSFQQP